jgi:hypothetical protein
MIYLLMELKGTSDQLEHYEDKVIIKRKGFQGKNYFRLIKGDKTIYLNQIWNKTERNWNSQGL